jgi:hypothetical protein
VASHALGLADLGLDSLEAVLGAALAMAGLLPLPLLQPLYQYVLYLHCSVVHTTLIIHNLLLVISFYLYYIFLFYYSGCLYAQEEEGGGGEGTFVMCWCGV